MLKYCTQCGSKLEEGERFCSNCGEKINSSETTYNNVPPPPSPSNNNYYKEKPYKESSVNNTHYNGTPKDTDNSPYNKNVLKSKTSSKNKFIIIISLIATVIILSICGYSYKKWKDNQNKTSSKLSTLTNNTSNNALNNTNSTNNTSGNTNKNNNSATDPSNNNNSSSNNILKDDMIKEYIALADSTCLNLFKAASEAEQNNKTKQPFASIRPLLQNCYSDAIVEGDLKPFYESHLGEWTYELGMAFPFYTKTYFEECSFTVIKRTDSIVQVKILDNNPEPLVYAIYTLKRYDKIWKIESIKPITND